MKYLTQNNCNGLLRRILLGNVSLTIGLLVAWFFPSEPSVIKPLIPLAVTVFPVLFGFCITIIAIVGGLDASLMQLSWERLQIYKETFENKILRQAFLGLSHLACLVCALALEMFPNSASFAFWMGKGFVFLGVLSLIGSFVMPFSLYYLYMEKYELLLLEKGAPRLP